MAYELLFQHSAQNDLAGIVCYLSGCSEKSAQRFKKAWNESLGSLREGLVDYALSRFPELAEAGYHTMLFGDYAILYFQKGETRTIAHDFHQKQDYARLV